MDKYKCSCCGGNINRATMTCEYCGTRYKEEQGNLLRVEMFQSPVQTLKSRFAINAKYFRRNPQECAEYAIKQLARDFAECIAPYMDMECSFDPATQLTVLGARIKVVEPINKPWDALERFSKEQTNDH